MTEKGDKDSASSVSNDATVYLTMSCKRLFTLSFLSGGLYILYWMYRNWKAVKLSAKENICPILRSYILSIFFIYPLFLRIKKSIQNITPTTKTFEVCSICFTVVWLIAILLNIHLAKVYLFSAPQNILAVLFGVSIFVNLILIAFLLPIQNEVNCYIAKTEQQLPQVSLAGGEIAITFIGFVLSYLSWIWAIFQATPQIPDIPNLTRTTTEQQVAIGHLLGDVYRNVYGYTEVCKENGYKLQYYPLVFKKAMEPELLLLNQLLLKDNLNIGDALNLFIPQGNRELIHQALYQEMQTISSSNEEGIVSACRLIDTQAENILETITPKSKEFYRQVLLPILK